MCGIIAASSSKPLNRNDVKLGLLLAEDRGGHATGFFDGSKILRTTSDVKRFLSVDKETIPLPDQINQFVGHTRYATKGKKNIANTHPFNFGTITGVHNGTIDNFLELKKEYGEEALKEFKRLHKKKEYVQNMTEIESDSMLLYYLIDRFGLHDTLDKLQGTMGLVWMDSNKRVNVYRYDKPLCYGYKDGELWLGSLKKYLEPLGCTRIKSFTEHSHYIIKGGKVLESKQLKKKLRPKEKASYQKNDVDPDLTTEKVENVGDSCSVPTPPKKEETVPKKSDPPQTPSPSTKKDTPYLFKAPACAEPEFVEGTSDMLLWWFSEVDYNIVYVEVEGFDDVLSYDLSEKEDLGVFKEDNPEIVDRVMQRYERLELANELRLEKEGDATLCQ